MIKKLLITALASNIAYVGAMQFAGASQYSVYVATNPNEKGNVTPRNRRQINLFGSGKMPPTPKKIKKDITTRCLAWLQQIGLG